jgi:beta-lactamase class A
MIDRRLVITGLPLIAAAPALAAADRFAPLRRVIATIERDAGGPFGVALLDTGSGTRFEHRAQQRFPLCSTFKLLLAARLLHGAQTGRWQMTDRLPVTQADMLSHAPFTERRIGGTASLLELADAMVTNSDNPAANIGLKHVGGPSALTAWLRAAGDNITRIDHFEPDMNNETPGDPRDTTTPAAMLAICQQLAAGRGPLNAASRARLFGWMAASVTADDMLRAGLPAGWKEANKTGSGAWHARGIVSAITPPGRPPIWVAAYVFAAKSSLAERNRHFPPLARAIVESLG